MTSLDVETKLTDSISLAHSATRRDTATQRNAAQRSTAQHIVPDCHPVTKNQRVRGSGYLTISFIIRHDVFSVIAIVVKTNVCKSHK
jgi:hypothetical protein